MYDRRIGDRELEFEASGALWAASLVMRDRQTDSWWSIMTSDAIGGPLAGHDLVELPVGEKTTWGEWRRRHPHTLALSVEGREHVESNPYDNYFASDGTFRGLEVDDRRLPAKEPVYAFHLDGGPHAAAHSAIAGGRLLAAPGGPVLLYRPPGASLFASSEGWRVDPAATADGAEVAKLLARARAGEPGFTRLAGFDTFWYTWVAVNRGSALLPAAD